MYLSVPNYPMWYDNIFLKYINIDFKNLYTEKLIIEFVVIFSNYDERIKIICTKNIEISINLNLKIELQLLDFNLQKIIPILIPCWYMINLLQNYQSGILIHFDKFFLNSYFLIKKLMTICISL